MEMRRIAPGSVFKVIAAAYGLIGMVFGVLVGLFRFNGMGSFVGGPAMGLLGGLLAGVAAGLMGALFAIVYNVIAGIIGGIRIDLVE